MPSASFTKGALPTAALSPRQAILSLGGFISSMNLCEDKETYCTEEWAQEHRGFSLTQFLCV